MPRMFLPQVFFLSISCVPAVALTAGPVDSPRHACERVAAELLGRKESGTPEIRFAAQDYSVGNTVKTPLSVTPTRVVCAFSDGSDGFSNGTRAEVFLKKDRIIAATLSRGGAAYFATLLDPKTGSFAEGKTLHRILVLTGHKYGDCRQPMGPLCQDVVGLRLILSDASSEVLQQDDTVFQVTDFYCTLHSCAPLADQETP